MKKGGASALKESGVEAVLGALKQIQQRRGLGDVVERDLAELRGGVRGRPCQPALNPLPFHRTNYAEPDGSADPAAQLGEDKEPGRGFRFESQQPTDRPEDRRKVTGPLTFLNQGSQCTQLLPAEAAFGRRQQRSALPSTGAVSNMIGRERIAEFIQFSELLDARKTGVNKNERAMRELFEGSFEKVGQIVSATHFAMLPRGFESPGMGEPAGGKG